MVLPLKIHVLGAGAIGGLVAHELSQSARSLVEVALLFRNQKRCDQFRENRGQLTVHRRFPPNASQSSSTLLSYLPPLPGKAEDSKLSIQNLIIATKTYQTTTALMPFLPYLAPDCNILILQNGMGMPKQLYHEFWSKAAEPPHIYEAITTHGAFKSSPRVVHHAAPGSITILKWSQGKNIATADLPPLILLILESPSLNASYVDKLTFLPAQMEKLVVNACINPLSALFDCQNGGLLTGPSVFTIISRIVKEATECLYAEFGEELKVTGNLSCLNQELMIQAVLKVCKATSMNSSSMREDVRHLRTTEVDSINGYIVNLGKKHRIGAPMNHTLSSLIRNKIHIARAAELQAANEIADDFSLKI